MDQAQYDAIKDNWGEVEDRDGVRLSWNTIPSTRMVGLSTPTHQDSELTLSPGSKPLGGSLELLIDTTESKSGFGNI